MELTKQESILLAIWETYGTSIKKFQNIEKYRQNEELIDEFFFIVLGGFGISYEMNLSALNVLKKNDLIKKELFQTKSLSENVELFAKEFGIKQFEPLTKDNQLRKYRFVSTKASTVASAGAWLLNECSWEMSGKLDLLEDGSRKWLCNCPGIGLKSASWFLRNAGYSDDYAVLDVHVIRFLKKLGIEVPKNITDKVYIYIESLMRRMCRKIDVSLGDMDYLLWDLGRNGYLEYISVE